MPQPQEREKELTLSEVDIEVGNFPEGHVRASYPTTQPVVTSV